MKKITHSKYKSYNVKYFEKNKTFEESSSQSSSVLRTQTSIYDGAFL